MSPEKQEFLELFHASGWSQADLARELDLTRGGVHGLVKGDTNPSIATVRLFRLVLAQKNPQAAAQVKTTNHDNLPAAFKEETQEGELGDLINSINSLPAAKRNELIETLKRVVKLVPKS